MSIVYWCYFPKGRDSWLFCLSVYLNGLWQSLIPCRHSVNIFWVEWMAGGLETLLLWRKYSIVVIKTRSLIIDSHPLPVSLDLIKKMRMIYFQKRLWDSRHQKNCPQGPREEKKVINNEEEKKKKHEIQTSSKKKWNGLLVILVHITAINSGQNIKSSCPKAAKSNQAGKCYRGVCLWKKGITGKFPMITAFCQKAGPNPCQIGVTQNLDRKHEILLAWRARREFKVIELESEGEILERREPKQGGTGNAFCA